MNLRTLLSVCAFVGSVSIAAAQTVTVSSQGTGDYTTLQAAIAAVNNDIPGPAEIVITDAGPFESNRIIINEASSRTSKSLTIRALPGIRPVMVVRARDLDGALYIRKNGEGLTVKDLVIIPATGDLVTSVAQAAIKIDNVNAPPPGFDDVSSVTLSNICVTANDGLNNPVGALDGLSSPTIAPGYVTFRDEGIFLPSVSRSETGHRRYVYMYDCVVTALNGDEGSDGIRSQMDGALGSENVVGPGCVISYNNTMRNPPNLTSGNAGIQPGGNGDGGSGASALQFKIEGSQDKPVKILNNNYHGILVSGSDTAGEGPVAMKWVIIANNKTNGFMTTNNSINPIIENMTIANNGKYAFRPSGSPALLNAALSFSNVIIAGNGNPNDVENVIQTKNTDPNAETGGTLVFSNSAIVLNGPYTLNNVDFGADGIDDPDAYDNVTVNPNCIFADPQFASLDPLSANFVAVTNPVFSTAGPSGQALVGGGKYGTTGVRDWQLF